MKNSSNKLWKRVGCLALTLSLSLSLLAGCGKKENPNSSGSASGSGSASQSEANKPEVMEGDDFGNGAIGTHGGVSSGSVYASEAGLEILKAGGNAIDAAVATAFAVGVCEPWLSGIGGCGMMTVYMKDTHDYEVLEYMETVPVAVQPGWYNPETDVATAKNAAVPGQVMGLLTALEKYGTMSREEVMAPAIKLARDGFAMEKRLADAIADNYDNFNEEGLAIYTNDGIPYAEGDLFKNEPLANTLQTIADGGIDAFYNGELADKMVEGLQANGSLMAKEDLASYTVAEREPIRTTYYGYEVVTVPPPSNGGDWLLEMLNIMENKDIKQYDVNSLDYLYVYNEACRIALTDSYSYIGDPAFFNLPVDQMISKEFAAERAQLIDVDNKAAMEEVPKSNLPVEKLDPTAEDSKHTTHIAVIDQYGNIVSTTNTLGNGWGCKFLAPGLGFYYNSHIGNLDHSNPDSPDYVMPGKRVRSTISPSLVLKDGNPIMAVGSPGSLAIPPAVAATINNVLLYGMNIQQAINLPRAMAISRSKGLSTTTMTIEQPRFDADLVAQLEAMGYKMKDVGEYNMAVGGIAAIYLDRENGKFYAGADPRRGYKALAY